jgi:hypothetical protein
MNTMLTKNDLMKMFGEIRKFNRVPLSFAWFDNDCCCQVVVLFGNAANVVTFFSLSAGRTSSKIKIVI